MTAAGPVAEHEKEKQRRQQWNLWDETTKANDQQSFNNDTSETNVAKKATSRWVDWDGIRNPGGVRYRAMIMAFIRLHSSRKLQMKIWHLGVLIIRTLSKVPLVYYMMKHISTGARTKEKTFAWSSAAAALVSLLPSVQCPVSKVQCPTVSVQVQWSVFNAQC